MARFRFKLDPLLRVRKRKEQLLQREVAQIQRERMEIESTLRRQQERIDEGRTTMRERLTGTLNAHDLRLHAGAVVQHMRRAQRLIPDLAALHQRLEAARERLSEAARHRRAIELLRDRRYQEWKREQEKAEQNALDEIAARKPSRWSSD